MDIRNIIRTVQNIESECKNDNVKDGTSGNFEHQIENKVDYEKFYNKVLAVIELADDVTRPKGGGTYG